MSPSGASLSSSPQQTHKCSAAGAVRTRKGRLEPSEPSPRVCRQSLWEISQPCSPSSALLSTGCAWERSGSSKGQTRLLQAGLVSENTCISEDESAACHLNVPCISPRPACDTQLGDGAHPALTLSAAAAQAEPLAAAQPGHSHSPGSRHQMCVKPAD